MNKIIQFLNYISKETQKTIVQYSGMPNTCILSAYVAQFSLEKLGYEAQIQAYYLDLMNEAYMKCAQNKAPVEAFIEAGAYVVSIRPDPNIPPVFPNNVPFHALVTFEAEGALYGWDLSRNQAARPQKNILVSPRAFAIPNPLEFLDIEIQGGISTYLAYTALPDWTEAALDAYPIGKHILFRDAMAGLVTDLYPLWRQKHERIPVY